ncbi:tRNA (cytidine(32)/guanosine(34)-2'-O)-methyltransferase [Malassezia obtusa]|uniref:tRNA (Cytidine(32)/guanosine(34)-2'-O)-methyltransferase n=1 Tax=Malassezia obtusa TaxID=76774 RepID=A0AAF0E030_9BASI|nr:tRNA (cytidine(32)/guanosine(34)-2'-O)-methyltransferase [Malassezia obtusa]
MGKSTKDQRDHFYRQGKQEGYRARSAYKLLQLDEHYGLFGGKPHALATQLAHDEKELVDLLGPIGHAVHAAIAQPTARPGYVIDLCAAPGSWSQVLSRSLSESGACIVAVDLQAMAPLDGVVQVVGDITTEATSEAVERAFIEAQTTTEVRKADLIVCDGAPDVTGIQALDEYVQSQLLMAAVSMAVRMLRAHGTFLAKVFVHPEADSARLLVAQLRRLFGHVELAKPSSSRASSAEHFVVPTGV